MDRLSLLYWDDVREAVHAVNPEFATIVDSLSPGKEYPLYKAHYHYGEKFLANAEFSLPNNKGYVVPLRDPSIPDFIKEDLNYNRWSNPVTLLLKNSIEMYMSQLGRIIPFSIYHTGKIFGLWRLLDGENSFCPSPYVWEATAGARSLFMLPKISDTQSHLKLKKKFGIDTEKPRSLSEHWHVFREITFSDDKDPWETVALIFSKSWFEKINDTSWAPLKSYLLESAWKSSGYWRNQFTWNSIFYFIQNILDIKPPVFIDKIVQHILAVSVGGLPGFRPAINNELAPIDKIQQAYMETYGLKEYAPIVMEPAFISAEENRSLYVSLHHQTAMELPLKSSEKTSALDDLYHIQILLKKYLREIATGNLKIGNTPLDKLPSQFSFDFFHNVNVESYSSIFNSEELSSQDPYFLYGDFCRNKAFPQNSLFFNGSVRITKDSK